jgi:UDP-N-acetyl-D-mannosaminuronate dehydrogenase
MHPNLDKFLLDIPKHIGGAANVTLRDLYTKAGITCVLHNKSRTVELAHVLNNFLYGVNVMATDEAAKYCREFGVDWMEILEYRKTNNSGFVKAGFPSKVSPILYPSSNHIGGHCVTYAPTTIPKEMRGQLATMLANYNK